MTQALLLHLLPPPCSSVSLSSRVAGGVHAPWNRSGICLRKEQYGEHLSDDKLRVAAIQQPRRLFPGSRPVTASQGSKRVSLKMTGDRECQGVVVAGTFDSLHFGHTQLLMKALSLVSQGGRLTVGISNGTLLSRKALSELIEPFHIRVGVVEQYLKELAESHGQIVNIRYLEIEEAIPKGVVSDPHLDCIVVNQYTKEGALAFNNCRLGMGLSPLKVVVVEIVHDEATKGPKFSSSSFRRQSLGTFIQREKGERLLGGPLVTGPYMVGLTGGIAAGKSYVRDLLKDKGAVVLDCDALGHLSYVPGTPTYQAMVAAFGQSIVNSVDGQIDRQILGAIVFTDPTQMDVLKRIVWAAVLNLVAEKRERIAEQGGTIVFAEAALLLEAHWEKEMNEIWVVFAPQDLSRQRLMLRNQISGEEANKRIRSQMSSEQRIALADVVIYNGWTKDETKQQVEKAWELLLQRVSLKSSQGKDEDPLWIRWAGLMRRLCINGEVALKWWPKVKSKYGEPWRQYHTFMHLQALYDHFHEYAHFIAEPRVFQLAIFFHRIVYHQAGVISRENELSSAATFEEFAKEASVKALDIEKVKAFILFNGQDMSSEVAVTGDLAFFLDFHLAVLGSGPKEYKEYKAKVRKEFKDCDDDQFQTLFKYQLRYLISHPRIFHTSTFQLKYSTAAQANLCDDDSLRTLTACL
ncbi:unnamed protein product [Calypogeia fissa]